MLPDAWEGYAYPENLDLIYQLLGKTMNGKNWTHRFDVPAHINEPNGIHLGPFVRTNVRVERNENMFLFGCDEKITFEGFNHATSIGFGWDRVKNHEPVYITIEPNKVRIKIKAYEIDDENEIRNFGFGFITFRLIE